MAAFTIRPSHPSDADDIATLFARSCSEAYKHLFPASFLARYTPTRQRERWNYHLENLPTSHRIFVAVSTEANTAIGFIEVGPSEEENTGEIHYLFVSLASMGVGVGTALIKSGENWLAEKGYRNGYLWVFCNNNVGKTFYLSKGWRESGVAQEEPMLIRDGISVMECKLKKVLREPIN